MESERSRIGRRFFTADLHFDHIKILDYSRRPFDSVQEMNNQLVKRWNSVVGPNDTIYVLGDFSMRSRGDNTNPLRVTLRKMHGVKHLILGNHDKIKPFTYVDLGFTSVHTSLTVKLGGTPAHPALTTVYLTHDPAVTRVNSDAYWLCGHVHDMFLHIGNVINVGVDVWDFKPVSEAQVLEEFERPSNINNYTDDLREEHQRKQRKDAVVS